MKKQCVLLVAALFLYMGQLFAQTNSDQLRSPESKIAAISDLVEKLPNSEAETTLLAFFNDPDSEVRGKAILSLRDQRTLTPKLSEALVRLSSSDNANLREYSIEALSGSENSGRSISNEAEIRTVTKAMGDPDLSVRIASIAGAAKIDPAIYCPTTEIKTFLEDKDIEVRLSMLGEVDKFKCDCSTLVPAIVEQMRNPRPDLRLASVTALKNLNGGADPAERNLADLALHDPDAEVRHISVVALQNTKAPSSDDLKELNNLVNDPIENVRRGFAYTLVLWGGDDQHAYDLLSSLQKDKSESVRVAVAEAVGDGKLNANALSLLDVSLRDRSRRVQYWGAKSLEKLGKPSSDNKDEENDDFVDDVVASFGVPRTSPWPSKLVSSCYNGLGVADSLFQVSLLNAIGYFRIQDASIRARVSQIVASEGNAGVRETAAEILPKIGLDPTSLNALILAANDKSIYVRGEATAAFGQISSSSWPFKESKNTRSSITRIQSILASRLQDDDYSVRLASAKALGKLFGKMTEFQFPHSGMLSTALLHATKDPDEDVREAAIKAWSNTELYSEADISALLNALSDHNLDVEQAAAQGLTRMAPHTIIIKQAVGLKPITLFDLTNMEEVVSKAKAELKRSNLRCSTVDGLIRAAKQPAAASVGFETFHSLITNTSALSDIIKALQDGNIPEDQEFVDLAAAAIDVLGPCVENGKSLIVVRLDDPNPRVRALAIEEVGSLPITTPEAREKVLEALSDPNPAIREPAISALVQLVQLGGQDKQQAVSALVARAQDPESKVREASVDALAELNSMDALLHAFDVQLPDVKKALLDELTKNQIQLSAVRSTISIALNDSDRGVRESALKYLDSRGLEAREFAQRDATMLSDNSSAVRQVAAHFLSYFKADASFAVPELETLLDDEDSGVRDSAIDALGWIGAESAIPQLTRLGMTSENGPHALKALKKLGPSSVKALGFVRDHSSDEDLQTSANQYLSELQQQTFPTIKIMLKDGSQQTVSLNNHLVVVAIATWCPYSAKLKDFLLREDVKPYFGDFEFVFLLEDETTTVHAHLTELFKDEGWNADRQRQLSEQVDRRLRDDGFFDSSFVEALPGSHYQVVLLKKLFIEGFPMLLSPTLVSSKTTQPNLNKDSWIYVRNWAYSDWFSDQIRMPDRLVSELGSISGESGI